MVDVDRASIFLQQPDFQAGFQDAFLPWIHDALCKSSKALKSGIDTSPIWSKDLLVQLVTVMQLLVSARHASQTAGQWVCGLFLLVTHVLFRLTFKQKPSLVDIFNTLSNSITALPDSIVLSTVQRRVRRFLNNGELPGSWIDITPKPAQLDSTNSLLDKNTYLVLDSAAGTLVLVVGDPQAVYLLGHNDVESLQVNRGLILTLKLRSPLPVLSLHLQDHESVQATRYSATLWINDTWFDEHVVFS